MKIDATIEKFFNPEESLEEKILVYLYIDKPDSPPCISFFQGEDTIKLNIPNGTLQKKHLRTFIAALAIAGQMK